MSSLRRCLAALTLAIAFAACWISPAVAQTPGKTDILLLLDTTGSMSGALDSAVSQVNDITNSVRADLGDVAFGVAEVRDYAIADFGNDGSGDVPYRVAQPITTDQELLRGALDSLVADGGGDGPEAYGRALRDADDGSGGLAWRPGARRLVILVADNMPHDTDLNEGIGVPLQIQESPFDTLADPGDDEVVGNADDIDWQPLLQRLAEHGLPIMYVLFEGDESYLPYWQDWAGRTGGAAASADAEDLSSTVVTLARQGATASLPPCPTGESRDAAGRCQPIQPTEYRSWLGYSFANAGMDEWAKAVKLDLNGVLTKEVIERVFADVGEGTAQDVARVTWWDFMRGGVCHGMALSGGRFSTSLDALRVAGDGRGAAAWAVSRTPQLPGPLAKADSAYREELLRLLAGAFVAQFDTQVLAAKDTQRARWAKLAETGGARDALRAQLDSVMRTGTDPVGHAPSARAVGLALVSLRSETQGHAIVAYAVRDHRDRSFSIDVWDNNTPGEQHAIEVRPDGSWSYGPLGWSGPAGRLAFVPLFQPRGLHWFSGGKTDSGREATIVDVPAGATGLTAAGHVTGGGAARVAIEPVPTGVLGPDPTTILTDGNQLTLRLTDANAKAVARGNGAVLSARGLTGGRAARARVDYDTLAGSLATDAPRTGTLVAARDHERVTSAGAQGLRLSTGGAVTATSADGGRVRLVLTARRHGALISVTLPAVRLSRGGSLSIGGPQVRRALGGGKAKVTIKHGKRKRALRLSASSVARGYRLRARVQVKRGVASVRLSARQRLGAGAGGTVRWQLKRGARMLQRRTISVARAGTGRSLAQLKLPRGMRGLTLRAVVRITVAKPAPTDLIASARRRVR